MSRCCFTRLGLRMQSIKRFRAFVLFSRKWESRLLKVFFPGKESLARLGYLKLPLKRIRNSYLGDDELVKSVEVAVPTEDIPAADLLAVDIPAYSHIVQGEGLFSLERKCWLITELLAYLAANSQCFYHRREDWIPRHELFFLKEGILFLKNKQDSRIVRVLSWHCQKWPRCSKSPS